MADVFALRESAPLISLVSPEMGLNRVTITRGDNSVNPSECVGAWPAVLDMNFHTLAHGRFFNELDEENADKFKSMVLVPSKVVDGVAIGIGMVLGAILFFVGLFLILWKGKSSYKA
jgi:hypothetical protein